MTNFGGQPSKRPIFRTNSSAAYTKLRRARRAINNHAMFRRLPRTIAMATSTAAHPFSSAAHPSPAAYSVAAAPVAASTAATVTADGDSPSHGNGALPRRMPIPPCGVDYRGKVVLAPMVRSGELPTRILALRYGADLVWGMFCAAISSDSLAKHVTRSKTEC